jgi:hypothetical protein
MYISMLPPMTRLAWEEEEEEERERERERGREREGD